MINRGNARVFLAEPKGEPKGGAKGDIAIHGGRLEDLGSHRFLVLGPIQVGDPPCPDLPERRLAGSAIT